jgi:hypothetical protein
VNRTAILLILASGVLLSGCVDNAAPGNDREASLDPPSTGAEVAAVGEALEGVATELLAPQIMTDADLRNLPQAGDRCLFRFTRVGHPVFVYGASTGTIKLNGKLVPLPARGSDRYAEEGVRVTVRPLDERKATGQFGVELVLRLQGAPDELGYHGFSEC